MWAWVNRSYLSLALMLGSIAWLLISQMVWNFGEGRKALYKGWTISELLDAYPIYTIFLTILSVLGILFFFASIYFLFFELMRNQGLLIFMLLTTILGLSQIVYFVLLFTVQIDPFDLYGGQGCVDTPTDSFNPPNPRRFNCN